VRQHLILRSLSSHLFVASILALSPLATIACDSEDGDSGSPNSGQASGSMTPSTAEDTGTPQSSETSECDDSSSIYGSDCQAYIDCATTHCGDAYERCLGPNYESGDFSGGQCQAYMECSSACDCDDETCGSDCYQEHAAGDCTTCLATDIGLCVATNCTAELQACGS